jgi:hypothetical protein
VMGNATDLQKTNDEDSYTFIITRFHFTKCGK